MQNVFIVGSKGFGSYGGYETFVDKLTECHQNNRDLKYHIACKANGDGCMDEAKLQGADVISDTEFVYHNARGFKIKIPNIGAAQAIYYDVKALSECCKYIEQNSIKHPIVYILACRIGPFAKYFSKKIHKLGGRIYLNPDGHEWKRLKWSRPIRKYWKVSERLMVKYSDLVICDSVNIEKYIQKEYRQYNPKTTFIAYGADIRLSIPEIQPTYAKWLKDKELVEQQYYLIVGRFVPENNFETMIREFMKSKGERKLVIITTENERFIKDLEEKLHFMKDERIRFVGAVYDQVLLKEVRAGAYGYLHGHEVGGTNPSLLEAMGTTNINLLLDVVFNREVGKDSALYWNKEKNNLALLIERADKMCDAETCEVGRKAKKRIADEYNWDYVAKQYEEVLKKIESK